MSATWRVTCTDRRLGVAEEGSHPEVVKGLLRVFGRLLAKSTDDEFETIVAAIDKARALFPESGTSWTLIVHEARYPVTWQLVKVPDRRRSDAPGL